MTISEWAPWIGGAIATIGGGAGIASFVRARPEANKIDADAAKVIQETSAEMVRTVRESVREDMVALKARVAELERTLKEREARDVLQDRRLRTHERWDQTVTDRLRGLGQNLPDPPPLYPDPMTA